MSKAMICPGCGAEWNLPVCWCRDCKRGMVPLDRITTVRDKLFSETVCQLSRDGAYRVVSESHPIRPESP